MTKFLGFYRTLCLSSKYSFHVENYCKFHFSGKLLRSDAVTSEIKRRTFKEIEDKNSKKSTPYGLYFLVIPVTALGLGLWQIHRKEWKEELISELEEKTHREPVPLPANIRELENMEYCPVRVKGKFLHDGEIHLGPRSLLLKGGLENQSKGLISQSGTGYLIVTPFKLADRDSTILVNRGWVPHEKLNQRTRPNGQITGEVDIVGIVRLNEGRPQFGAKNRPESNIWSYRDLNAMAEIANTDPVFIDAVASSSVPGGPIAGQTMISLRNEHLSYIITWFGISIATGVLWYMRFGRALRKPAHP